MWRGPAKIPRSSRLSARQFSHLTERSAVPRIMKKVSSKFGKHNTLQCFSTTNSSSASSGGSKVVIGSTLAVTGGVAAGLYYVKNDEAFRRNIEQKLPFTSSVFDAVLGKSTSDTNLKPPAIKSPPIVDSSENQLFDDKSEKKMGPLTESVVSQTPAKEAVDKNLKGDIQPTATVSSVDQIAVSSVDLDISKTVEKEVLDEEQVEPAVASKVKETVQSAKKKSKVKVKKGEAKKEKEEQLEKVVKKDNEKQQVVENSETSKEEASDNTVSAEMMEKSSFEIALQTALATASQLGDKALDCHHRAIEAIQLHRTSLSEALHRAEHDSVTKEHWQALGILSQTKTKAVYEAKDLAAQLNDVIEKVQMMIAEGKEKGLETSSEMASEMVAKLTYDLQEAKNHLKETENEGTVLKQFQDIVEEGKQQLREQLASIRPEITDEKAETKVNEDLLAYAQDRIRVLEDALEKREVEERKVIEEALTKQQKEQEKLAEMRLKHELETLKNELTNYMKTREAAMLEEHEQDIRQQLRRQATVFGDHLNDVLKVQANELNVKHQSEKRQELLLQRQEFELKLRGTLSRLEAIMAVLQNRADIEKANFEAQELWLACQSFATAITGLGDDHPRLHPVRAEVDKIRHITSGNKMVGAVLDALPDEVLDRGVFCEETLRRRFPHVRKVCKQVAMIGEEGGGVWSYLLSYLQSFLVFDVHAVTKPDLVDPDELDTHTILSLAATSLEEGDTEQAVRYMTQLRGEPRRVAEDWVREARLFLETKQVTRLLTSFASAYNIGAEQ